jgi:hypothetical protein
VVDKLLTECWCQAVGQIPADRDAEHGIWVRNQLGRLSAAEALLVMALIRSLFVGVRVVYQNNTIRYCEDGRGVDAAL